MPALGSRYRLVKTMTENIAFRNGARSTPVKLPKGLFLKGLLLKLTGTLDVGAAVATVFSAAPLPLLRNVHIIGDGRRHLATIPGVDLYRLAQFTRRGIGGPLVAPSGAIGSNAFTVIIPLDFEALMFFNPVESLFDPRRYREVTIEVEWGQATDIASAGGGGTIAIGAATQIEVQVENTAVGQEQMIFDHLLTTYTQPITATNPALEIDIPTVGLLAGMQIRAMRDLGAGAGPAFVNDLINTVAVKSDQSVFHVDPQPFTRLQEQNYVDFGFDPLSPGLATANGVAYLRLHEHGSFGSALNVSALNTPKLILDVTRNPAATENVIVTWDAFEPIPA